MHVHGISMQQKEFNVDTNDYQWFWGDEFISE